MLRMSHGLSPRLVACGAGCSSAVLLASGVLGCACSEPLQLLRDLYCRWMQLQAVFSVYNPPTELEDRHNEVGLLGCGVCCCWAARYAYGCWRWPNGGLSIQAAAGAGAQSPFGCACGCAGCCGKLQGWVLSAVHAALRASLPQVLLPAFPSDAAACN